MWQIICKKVRYKIDCYILQTVLLVIILPFTYLHTTYLLSLCKSFVKTKIY